jgi:uroporphyrinogen-III decarboxylase
MTGERMTARERVAVAMRLEQPDRVPVMCQLAVGHYFLQTDLDPVEIWHDSAVFAEALIQLQRRYGFDGILVNLPGRDPDWRRQIRRIEEVAGERRIHWAGGRVTVLPPDDLPQVYLEDGRTRPAARLETVDPERLYYVEPYDLMGLRYPEPWGSESSADYFPPWQWDTLRYVRAHAPRVSVHGEVFSPFSQLLELLGYEQALLALMDDPQKVHACLAALTEGTAELMRGHARAGADAVLVSSAFAGAGLISREHYQEFVLPYERGAIRTFRQAFPGVPVYTHTCGAIGDRLELLEETGTQGIDTLDPPPLGNVELADAKRRIGERLFIKGNMNPVDTLLLGTPEQCYADALHRIEVGAPGGGYILSTACSVAPATPPENILQLRAAVEETGWYGAEPVAERSAGGG